jgi:hypothetical protein
MGRLIRAQIENAKSAGEHKSYLQYAGAIKGGPTNVSSRKGFSRS